METFFRSLSQVLTGSQDYHEEVRLLVTSYMVHNSTIPERACILVPNETMDQYLKRMRMQSMNVWATEMGSCVHAEYNNLLFFTIFKWLRHSPRVVSSRMDEEESIHKQSF